MRPGSMINMEARSMREFLVGLVVLCGVVAVPSKAAEETETLWRFDFANDMFADSDNLFSAGWSV